jgi:hypothetical protein
VSKNISNVNPIKKKQVEENRKIRRKENEKDLMTTTKKM